MLAKLCRRKVVLWPLLSKLISLTLMLIRALKKMGITALSSPLLMTLLLVTRMGLEMPGTEVLSLPSLSLEGRSLRTEQGGLIMVMDPLGFWRAAP